MSEILKNYPTWDNFKKRQHPQQLLVNYDDVKSVYEVVSKDRVTLEQLTEAYKLKDTHAGIEYLIEWTYFLNTFSNVNKSLPAPLVRPFAYLMYSKYKNFTLPDLKILFENILESKYGSFYGSIDTQRLATAFLEYGRERYEVVKKIREREEDTLKKSDIKSGGVAPDFSKYPNLRVLARGGNLDLDDLAKRISKR